MQEAANFSPATRWLRLLALLTTASFALLFLYAAGQRLVFPHEIRWMEGGILDQVLHIRTGEPLYAEPSWQFATYIYTPLYYYLSTAVSYVTGPTFVSIRIVSLLSSVAVAALVGAIVRRETGSAHSAWVAGLFYLAAWKATGFFMDTGRFDTFFLALVLGCLYCARYYESTGGQIVAAVLGALALMTKQTAVIACVPVVIYLFFTRSDNGRFVLPVAGTLLGAAGLAYLYLSSAGWFAYYVFELPGAHRYQWEKFPDIAGNDFLLTYPFVIALGAAAFWLSRQETQHRQAFIPVIFLTLLAAALLPYMHTGSAANVLMPLQGGSALLLGFALGKLEKQPRLYPLALVLVIPQLALLGYNPQTVIPGEAEAARSIQQAECMAAFDGPVLNTRTGYLWQAAGKDMSIHEPAVADIFRTGPSPQNAAMRETFVARVNEQYYDAIFFGPQMMFELGDTLQDDYTSAGFNFTPKAAGEQGKGYMLSRAFVANRWLEDRTLPEGIGLCDALLTE